MPCSICSAIPDVTRANTGRDEVFPAPVRSLERHELGREDDLWECPACAALFHWHDASSWTGSGNDDEEVLTRLPASQAALVRARRGTPWIRQFLRSMGNHVEDQPAPSREAPPTPRPAPEPEAASARDEPWTRMERPLGHGIPLENARAFVLEIGARLGIRGEDTEVTVTRKVEEDLVSMDPAEVSTSLAGRLGAVHLHAFAGKEPFRELSLWGPTAEVDRVDRAVSAIFAERFTPEHRTRNDLLLPDAWEERARHPREGEVALERTSWLLQPEGEAWFAVEVSASGVHRTAVGPVPRVVDATTIRRRRTAGGAREPFDAEAVASAVLGESLGPPEKEATIDHGGEELGRRRRFRLGAWIVLDGRARWSTFLPEVLTVRVHHEGGDPWCLLAEVVSDDDADEATIRVLGPGPIREDVARRLCAALDDAGWSSPGRGRLTALAASPGGG